MLRSSSGAHAGATRPAGVFRLLFVVVVTLALAGLAAAVPSPTQANVTYEGVTYSEPGRRGRRAGPVRHRAAPASQTQQPAPARTRPPAVCGNLPYVG